MHRAYKPTLPSTNLYLQYKWDVTDYENHKYRVTKIKPKIDNKAPRTFMHCFIKRKVLQAELEQRATIQRENNILARKLAALKMKGGWTDTVNYHKIKSLNGWKRQKEMIELTYSNQTFQHRLRDTHTSYNKFRFEDDFQTNLKYRANIMKWPHNWRVLKKKTDQMILDIRKKIRTPCSRTKSGTQGLSLSSVLLEHGAYEAVEEMSKTKSGTQEKNLSSVLLEHGVCEAVEEMSKVHRHPALFSVFDWLKLLFGLNREKKSRAKISEKKEAEKNKIADGIPKVVPKEKSKVTSKDPKPYLKKKPVWKNVIKDTQLSIQKKSRPGIEGSKSFKFQPTGKTRPNIQTVKKSPEKSETKLLLQDAKPSLKKTAKFASVFNKDTKDYSSTKRIPGTTKLKLSSTTVKSKKQMKAKLDAPITLRKPGTRETVSSVLESGKTETTEDDEQKEIESVLSNLLERVERECEASVTTVKSKKQIKGKLHAPITLYKPGTQDPKVKIQRKRLTAKSARGNIVQKEKTPRLKKTRKTDSNILESGKTETTEDDEQKEIESVLSNLLERVERECEASVRPSE